MYSNYCILTIHYLVLSSDQIPFAVSLDQVNDIVAGDMRFIQNRAIAFTIALHDPSEYLSNADITFNWDFGDASGALISRELTVTHTYINSGSYKPQVVIQAVIPDKACDPPVDTPTKAPGPPTDHGTTGKERKKTLTSVKRKQIIPKCGTNNSAGPS